MVKEKLTTGELNEVILASEDKGIWNILTSLFNKILSDNHIFPYYVTNFEVYIISNFEIY
jgi:hypothetical protein